MAFWRGWEPRVVARSSNGAGGSVGPGSRSSSRPTSERRARTADEGESYPKRSRLLKRGEYLRVQRGGRKLHTRSLLILVKPNRVGRTRLGIAVSKKYGNSVQRNRIKRLVREVFRRNRSLLPRGVDLVVVPKRLRHRPGYRELVAEVGACMRKTRP